jgi:predicted hydrolase (HD superfamily)
LCTNILKSPNLIKHMLAVEAAMRFYARKFGEDEEKWAVTALLHDFDWEIHPTMEEHPWQANRFFVNTTSQRRSSGQCSAMPPIPASLARP